MIDFKKYFWKNAWIYQALISMRHDRALGVRKRPWWNFILSRANISIRSNELNAWELDLENTAVYTTTNNGMIAFTIPYNSISEDEDQSEFEEDVVLNYFINPETLKIRQTLINEDLEPGVISGSCIKQKQR